MKAKPANNIMNFFTAVVLGVIVLLSGCEKAIDWPVAGDNNGYIVVDGMITNEYKTQELRLTKTISAPNDMPEVVSNAEVIVSTDDNVYTFSEDSTQPGRYISDLLFAGVAGKEYTLFINANNSIISAKAKMVAVSDFIFLKYAHQGNKDLFRITWVSNPYSAGNPAMYEVLLNWSAVPGYEALPPDSTSARLLYYTLPTLDVSQMFAPEMETVLFPPGTTITENKYALTTEHAAYIRALLAETNYQGGLFNSVPSNLPRNLSGRGIGYFSACTVISKTRIARGGNNF